MTEQIKSLVEVLESIKDSYSGTDNINAINISIRSLKAWDEVIEELDNIRNHPIANLNQYFIDGIDVATEIIKKKLSEVEA